MTEQSFAKSSSVSHDRSLDTLTQIRTQRHSEPLQFLGPGRYAGSLARTCNVATDRLGQSGCTWTVFHRSSSELQISVRINPLVPGNFFSRISLPKLVERCIA